MGKGEIACYEQFLLFPVFSNDLFQKVHQKGVEWEWVKGLSKGKGGGGALLLERVLLLGEIR